MPPSALRHAIDEVDALEEELVALRRDLHAHPELAWQETRTTALIAERLDRAGLEIQLLPKSGLLAELGAVGGPMVALRADLDGLPVDDRGDEPWASAIPAASGCCSSPRRRSCPAVRWR